MGALMVCCPATGCRISLRVELDQATFDRTPDLIATFTCGAEHSWSRMESCKPQARPAPSSRSRIYPTSASLSGELG
jgi:hypothetical protein